MCRETQEVVSVHVCSYDKVFSVCVCNQVVHALSPEVPASYKPQQGANLRPCSAWWTGNRDKLTIITCILDDARNGNLHAAT
jgi:hypothetical protein